MKLINIGYGNTVNSDRVIAAVSADAAPVKRIISAAKDNNCHRCDLRQENQNRHNNRQQPCSPVGA